jgi:hypothetical protein
VSDIERESQAVLDSVKEKDFHGVFEARGGGGTVGITVYVPKETILNAMAAKIKLS